ncbi:MAG: hypothetical protein R3F30_15495 [Planctomycetota bacterium]
MHMSKFLVLGGALALTPAPALAQTKAVFPPLFDKLEGYSSASSYSTGHFAYATSSTTSRPFRSQLVMDIDKTVSGKIAGLAYRRESVSYQGTPFPGGWVDLEVTLGTAATTSATVSTTFATNVGGDATVVIARKKVNLPPVPYTGGFPEPFLIRLPFDSGKNLAYDASKGSLLVEFKSYDNDFYDSTTSTYKRLYLDRAYNTSTGAYISVGAGEAYNPYVSPMDVYTSLSIYNNTTVRWYSDMDDGLPGGIGVFVLAVDGLNPNAGIKFPNGSPWYLDLLKTVDVSAGLISQSGEMRWPASGYIEVPYTSNLVGVNVDVQGLMFDAKTMQMWTSNAYRRQIPDYKSGGTFPVDGVYKNGSTAFTSATGSGMSVGYAPVVELTLN